MSNQKHSETKPFNTHIPTWINEGRIPDDHGYSHFLLVKL